MSYYTIYEVDSVTGKEKLVKGLPRHTDRGMALMDRSWLMKALEDESMATGKEIAKYYRIKGGDD
jgi:hypothetical protein